MNHVVFSTGPGTRWRDERRRNRYCYTLARTVGADDHQAAVLANAAAGVVVAKLGTATLSPEELERAV